MNKLHPGNKLNPTKKSIALAVRHYQIFDITFDHFQKGIANTTMGIYTKEKKFVMRFYAQHRKSNQQILFELKFQNQLRKNGIPIPKIYSNVDGKKLTHATIDKKRWQIVLMEFIEGSNKTTEHTPQLIKELATIQARMHLIGRKIPRQKLGKEKSWDKLLDYYALYVKKITSYPQKVQKFVDRAKNFNYSLDKSLPFGYCHLDFDLDGNVIAKNNQIKGIIDFDDLSYSPIVVCLGYSLWNVLHDENMKKVKSYLKYYEKIRPLSCLEKKTLPYIILFRNYEIGALRLYNTNNSTCLKRPFEIEAEIITLLSHGL